MVELNDDIGEEKRIELWKMLLKLRLVEKKAYDLFLENLIKGTSHLSLGQEAIGSAFGVALQKKILPFARIEVMLTLYLEERASKECLEN